MTETLKYKVGDIVKTVAGDLVKVDEINFERESTFIYHVRRPSGFGWWTDEADLEPVTEKQEENSMTELKYQEGDLVLLLGKEYTVRIVDSGDSVCPYWIEDESGSGRWVRQSALLAPVVSEPPVKQELDSYTAQLISDYFEDAMMVSDLDTSVVLTMVGFFDGLKIAGAIK